MEKLGILAVAVQVITEAVSRFYPKGTIYFAGVIGIVVAILAKAGLLAALGEPVSYPVADYVLAGLVLAGGASVLNRLTTGGLSKAAQAPEVQAPEVQAPAAQSSEAAK